MKRQTLKQIADYANARLSSAANPDAPGRAVSIETRTLDAGDRYVPIIGERLDGHRFIDTAFAKGAIACFHDSKHIPSDEENRAYLSVENTTEAFTQMAANYRASLDLTVIGLSLIHI